MIAATTPMPKGSDEFAEYLAKRTVQPPRLLYKYTSLEAAAAIIDNETLLCRSPRDFNDPFDGQWNTLWQLSTKAFNSATVERLFSKSFDPERIIDPEMRDWVKKERVTLLPLKSKDKRAHIEQLKKIIDPGIILKERISDQLKRLRVCCLARIPDSIQMWSYYAQSHTGVLLAFDVHALEHAWKRPIEKVHYANSLPKIINPRDYLDYFTIGGEIPEMTGSDRAARLWTLTKADSWRHEKEWRFVFITDHGDVTQHLYQRFPIRALHGIAAGCKTNMQEFARLARLLHQKNPEAEFWRTARHAKRFDLVAGRLAGPPPD